MEITEKKYQALTKQIYNQIKSDNGENFKFTPKNVYIFLKNDELLSLLTSKLRNSQKVGISFMVFLFSNNVPFSDIFNRISNNLSILSVNHYFDLDYKDEECDNCGGRGYEECSECSGSGNVDCSNCSGSGDKECDTCDGSGEDDEGDNCSECNGNGEISCDYCDRQGNESCDNCNGNGEYDCYDCDGSGSIESSDKKWRVEFGDIYTINPRVKYFEIDSILQQEEVSVLNTSLTIRELSEEDQFEEENNPYFSETEANGKKEVWVIESIDEVLI